MKESTKRILEIAFYIDFVIILLGLLTIAKMYGWLN